MIEDLKLLCANKGRSPNQPSLVNGKIVARKAQINLFFGKVIPLVVPKKSS